MNASTAMAEKPTRQPDTILNCPGSTLFNLKKILVPVDFSECSEKALLYAVQFAKEFCATLDVVYVSPPFVLPADVVLPSNYTRIEKDVIDKAEQRLATLVLQRVPQGIPVEPIVRSGHAVTEIVNAAKEFNADLIIISTHGRTGLKHVLIGSTAEEVVRHAPCPVLTVREKEHEFLAE